MAATIKETFKINSSIQNCFPFLSSIQKFNEHKIIITESINLTLIYDLSKFFCVRSFTFTSLLPLTAPMVYDSTRDCLVAIKNKTKIDLIKNELENDEVQSIRLNKDQQIKCILTGDSCGCLVVFENNWICELEKIIENESVNFENDCIYLHLPAEDCKLQKLVVVSSNINNLKFWASFTDSTEKVHHHVLFNYNFILCELNTITKILIKKPDLYKSISFSSDNLLAITQDHKFRILNQSHEEFIFDLTLKDGEQLLDHGFLQLKENISAISVLTYDKIDNTNYLLAYDLNLRMQMKRIALPITNQHEHQIQLNCLNSNVFVQTNQSLIYIPVKTEELSLADLIASYKSNLNFDELDNLTFENIMNLLAAKDIKPIDKELLLVEALEKFIFDNKQELEANSINDMINGEMMNNSDRPTNCLPSNLMSKLNQLFFYSFNADFLIRQFKRKQFKREFLVKILDLLSKAMNSENCKSVVRVIDWINVVLDSYFICLNSSINLELIKHLNNIKQQTEQLALRTKTETDLKCLLATLLLAINDESNSKRQTRITLPDNKHLGYKLEEIFL